MKKVIIFYMITGIILLAACTPVTMTETSTTMLTLTTTEIATTKISTTSSFEPSTSTSGTTSATLPSLPTATVRGVPEPAPAPWSGIVTYTERTYQIEAKVGEEFAIGMFATGPWHFMESNDQSFIKMEDHQMVEYSPQTLNKFGTEWFLFKAIKPGNTEIIFQYPIEYTKLFIISIK